MASKKNKKWTKEVEKAKAKAAKSPPPEPIAAPPPEPLAPQGVGLHAHDSSSDQPSLGMMDEDWISTARHQGLEPDDEE